MISFKDYAREYGVTYEAVRQQVKRYQAELEGHIHQQGRTQYLDDVAVAFLSEHRAKPVMAVYDGETDRRIQDLEQENKELLKALNGAKDRIIELQGIQVRLELAEAAQRALEESRDEYKDKVEKKELEVEEASQRANLAEKELAAYKALPWYKKLRRG